MVRHHYPLTHMPAKRSVNVGSEFDNRPHHLVA
jgi:hypothetical protein